MSSTNDLTSKVAIVTGGSRGLGREIALAFARAGAAVVVASRKVEVCREVADLIVAGGGEALAVAYHSARWDDAERLTNAAYDRFGQVDVLVNNAGSAPTYPSLAAMTEDYFDKVVGINLKGPFRLTSLVGSRMAHAGGGSILFVSSIAARRPRADELVYAASKGALITATAGFAQALGPTVRVNCISPGPFRTDIARAWDLDAYEGAARQRFALQRIGEPHEIVGAALYFASDASSYTTGAVLDIDGGPRAS